MLPFLDHQERAERAQRDAPARAALPHRREFVLQVEPAERVKQQKVLPLAVVRAADQRNLALSGNDARERNPHRIRPRRLLAHEGARGAGHPVHDRNIAGQEI